MNDLRRRIAWRKILYRVGITLGLGLLAHQAWQGTLALQQTQACVARPSYLLATIAAYIAAYVVQMAAWAMIMAALHAPLTPKAVLQGYALAFLPRYIPGSVWGYLSRNEWLAQSHGVSYAVSTTSSLMEAAMLLVTASLLGALYWLPTRIAFPLLNEGIITVAIVALGIAALWTVWHITPWIATRFTRRGGEESALTPVTAHGPHNRGGLFAGATLLYLIFWGLQGLALVAVAHTFCEGVTLTPFAATAAASIAWALGFLVIFVPAGLGVREWTLGALLVAFATLQPGQATLLAVTSRLGLIVAEVAVLLFGLHAQIAAWWQRRNDKARSLSPR